MFVSRSRFLLLVLLALVVRAQDGVPEVAAQASANAIEVGRSVESVLETQVELHRRGFSCGSIDGVMGPQTASALRAFQRSRGLSETGTLDTETRTHLQLTRPALTTHEVTSDELASLLPLPASWLARSQQSAIPHASALELVAELNRANPRFVRRLNPEINWDTIQPGTVCHVPAPGRATFSGHAAEIRIGLEARKLEVFDPDGRVIAHFPVSIARKVEKRPIGELRVTVAITDPNYTFDPEVYPESEEARQLGRKLIVPPGPNNPVGRAWIGLNRSGYGIHGTPDPEKIGRTESHGCFRLANWDAVALTGLVYPGLLVVVEP